MTREMYNKIQEEFKERGHKISLCEGAIDDLLLDIFPSYDTVDELINFEFDIEVGQVLNEQLANQYHMGIRHGIAYVISVLENKDVEDVLFRLSNGSYKDLSPVECEKAIRRLLIDCVKEENQ